MQPLRAVKGMNDILPEEVGRWNHLESRFRELSTRYGFGEVRMPVMEPTELFVRSIGETTDIVEKEMYTFTDKGDHSLTLRPEGTASAVRCLLQHSVHAQRPVVKWFYIGPMFRRERPAKGRYRQFHQVGAEIFGDEGPYSDAELIDMAVTLLHDLGVAEVEVLVNSLGGPETRPRYRDALVTFLAPHREQLCADCQRRMEKNPLRVLDCKVPADSDIARQAPSLLGMLADQDRAHFDGLLETLTALGTPHKVEPTLVRGLDYYTRTLFEIRGTGPGLGAQNTLFGGGRYDRLVKSLGGPGLPAIGFAAGIERLLLAMSDAPTERPLDVFVVTTNPELRTQVTALSRELRRTGLRVDADLRGQSLKSQFRRADKSGARIAAVLGDEEAARGVVLLKDLEMSTQVEVPRETVAQRVFALLGQSPSERP